MNTNSNIMSPSYFKRYKIIKIIQLALEAAVGITYFLMIFLNRSIANVLFTNRPIFLLSFFMWVLLLINFCGAFFDFYSLQVAMNSSQLLGEIAYLDATTGIPNRNSCDDFIKLFKTKESIKNAGCAVIAISNLASINNTYGHEAGNTALKTLSSLLEEACSSYGFVGRNGSNDFLAIIDDCDDTKMKAFLDHFRVLVDDYNAHTSSQKLCIKQAYVLNQTLQADDIYDMIRTTYQTLFQN